MRALVVAGRFGISSVVPRTPQPIMFTTIFALDALASKLLGRPLGGQRRELCDKITPPSKPSWKRHDSVLDLVGNTPLVKLSPKMTEGVPDGVEVYAKLEAFNPMGSVKDRLAIGVIEWAERTGELKPGQTVVEATSGNTGIGLAMVCAVKGYPFVAVMAESFSIERRKLMRFMGAKVVLTNPAHKGSGMLIKAKELADKHGWFLPMQFANEANADIHRRTTGPEIVNAFIDHPTGKVDHIFLGYGTGGTFKGVAGYVKDHSPGTTIHVCEPDNAPLLYSGIGSEFDQKGLNVEAHPVFRPHLLMGWTPDFIPPLVSSAVDQNLMDELHHVAGDKSIKTSQNLAANDGIFTGISGGGSVYSALEYAKTAKPGSTIVALCADTGERYLSTPLFGDIISDMSEEEKAIADSTPSNPPPPVGLPPVTPEATTFVKEQIAKEKIVIFSLEYCEFCWTIFGLLKAVGANYHVVCIDAFEYAKDNMGNKYRAALQDMTDCKTFPQFFVDGKFIGGAVDACLMWKKGELQPVLKDAGVDDKFNNYDGDPFEFLPKWMSQNPLRDR